MSENEMTLRATLQSIPDVQKLFLVALTQSSEKKENRNYLFASNAFRETLASNLFYLLTFRKEYKDDCKTDKTNFEFLENFIWAIIETVPPCILVSVILANIEFNYDVDLSDYHKEFGRDVFMPGRDEIVEPFVDFNKMSGSGRLPS